MSNWKVFAVSALAVGLLSGVPLSPAQVSINIGPEPVCPYGYYDFQPYNCAPYGYYGPDWYTGGVFIGAGPWFHGQRGFYGHVDNRFDPRHGYAGPFPGRGDQPFQHFRGNEARDGQGHFGDPGHGPGGEHSAGYQGFHGGGGGPHGGGEHGGGEHGGGEHH